MLCTTGTILILFEKSVKEVDYLPDEAYEAGFVTVASAGNILTAVSDFVFASIAYAVIVFICMPSKLNHPIKAKLKFSSLYRISPHYVKDGLLFRFAVTLCTLPYLLTVDILFVRGG